MNAARAAFIDFVKENRFEAAGLGGPVADVLSRLRLLNAAFGEDWPAMDAGQFAETADDWLAPALGGGRFQMPSAGTVAAALKHLLGWPKAQEIDALAPDVLDLPSGRKAPIDYHDDNAPLVEAKAQELSLIHI